MTDEINKIVNKLVEDATKKTEEKFHNQIKQLKYDHSLERLRDARQYETLQKNYVEMNNSYERLKKETNIISDHAASLEAQLQAFKKETATEATQTSFEDIMDSYIEQSKEQRKKARLMDEENAQLKAELKRASQKRRVRIPK
ncbi:Oidioi.mRNA.OKI2018_I69.XSR.g14440.t1.cds [Oikopleura dioica]|uniref:Oidioi.mRNA.OKI2018_I69.XSR.g14440.t1.cds n=1 Tax=Oikopleura dioica TaxID=34765 RepID=A0ABN7SDR2_OIKDI|nr:Oidioi.mRNA.OKI2018_I69.XSR.g14440.t1.cds [Oikopleura dioica]